MLIFLCAFAPLREIILLNTEETLKMTQATAYEHIVIDEKGIPLIEGTNMKIIELVLEINAHGWSPEEVRFQHPYLSLGQIHSALAYYWDNADALNQDIERRLEKVETIRKAVGNTALRDKLKAKGLI